MFYLVTGGCGFIGSALTQLLLRQGHRVRVLDNGSRGSASRLKDARNDIEFVQADIRDSDAVAKAARKVDRVCHLAFVNGTEFFYSKPDVVLDVGVKGMVNVIEACLKNDVGELILASSSEVYQTPPTIPTDETVPLSIPDPMNPRYSYAAGKMISEIMAINWGRKHFRRVVIFRPHNVYGPDMGWEHVVPQFVLRMKELCRGSAGPVRFPIQGTGEETRAFVYISDFVEGVRLVMDQGEHLGIYHIGQSEELKIAQVARMVGEYFNREVELVPGAPAQGGTPRRCPDITKIKKLGYEPTIKFSQGLQITARWYDEHSEERPKTTMEE